MLHSRGKVETESPADPATEPTMPSSFPQYSIVFLFPESVTLATSRGMSLVQLTPYGTAERHPSGAFFIIL